MLIIRPHPLREHILANVRADHALNVCQAAAQRFRQCFGQCFGLMLLAAVSHMSSLCAANPVSRPAKP